MADQLKTSAALDAMDPGAAFRLLVVDAMVSAYGRGVSKDRVVRILRLLANATDDHSLRRQRTGA